MNHDQLPNRHDTIACTVRKVLARRTNDVHLIDDVCQNVLVICWQREPTLRDLPSERLERFVGRVALNQFYSCVRKRKLLKWPEGFEKGSSDEDPALATGKTEEAIRLLSLFNGLPLRYREITRLHIVEGWTHERIAKDKGVPVSTIKTQFRRAKALLEEAVKRDFVK